MKTLNQHIQEKLIINQRFDEKLIINKNYKSVSYDFSDVKELYLVRFLKNKNTSENYITIDIINVESIIIKDDNNCILNGDFKLKDDAFYLKMKFKCDLTNGILYRVDGLFSLYLFSQYFEILIHPLLKDKFKKFVEDVLNNPDKTYFADDVFDILNIECPEFEDKINVKYDYIYSADDPKFMKKLAKELNIK